MAISNDPIVPEMRERLRSNRLGTLTSGQWLDMVMQPIGTLLTLAIPLSFLLLPRVATLARAGLLSFVVIAGLLLLTLVPRAYRYARAPVHFARLHATRQPPPFWAFWAPLRLTNDAGEELTFKKRLAPRPIVQRDRAYLVYYLVDHNEFILLSIAPADHPNAERWSPGKRFEARFNSRSAR